MGIRVGDTINRTFAPLSGNPVTVLGLALLPMLTLVALAAPVFGFAALSGIETTDRITPALGVWFGVIAIGMVVASAVAQGGIIAAALAYYRTGEKLGIGRAVSEGLRLVLPIIGLFIVVGVSVAIGLVLLIIPGLVLLVKLSAAIPAEVSERPGVFGSVRRSWNLTSGSFWPIVGVFVVLFFVVLIVSMVLGVVSLVASGFGGAGIALDLAARVVVNALQAALGATVGAAIYHELRQEEGGDTAALQETFA